MSGINPRQTKCVDVLSIVPDFGGDWESWSEEMERNRAVLISDMAAPEFIADIEPTLSNTPLLFIPSPSPPEALKTYQVVHTWPFQAQPQNEEDLRDDLQYFFPSLTEVDVVPPTPEQPEETATMAAADASSNVSMMKNFIMEAEEGMNIPPRITYDEATDDNPWNTRSGLLPTLLHGPSVLWSTMTWTVSIGLTR